MARKLNIKVVAGALKEPAMLRLWEQLALRHHVEIFVQRTPDDESLSTVLPTVVFPVVEDMPNFFRDIDRHLRGADLVIGIETSRLYSFQALRAARKMGVPFVCVVHEYSPFAYEKYLNLRAIQRDIFENSALFLGTSRRAVKLLELEGVDSQRIERIDPVTDPDYFAFSEPHAKKFRNYVGIPQDSIVITVKGSLENPDSCLTIVQGVRLGLSSLPKEMRDKVRLLICGQGGGAERVKYEIADMGLGAKTLFLTQDPTRFYRDLICATDIVIEGRSHASQVVEELPWHVISAIYSGVQVIVPGGSIADDIAAGRMIERIEDFTAMHVGDAVAKLVKKFEPCVKQREVRGSLASESLSLTFLAEKISSRLEEIALRDERSLRRDGLVSFVKQHNVPIAFKDAQDVLVKCEEVRDFSSQCEVELYSEVLRIRGDALVALTRGDEALTSFEDALKQDSSNYRALRGLGYLAWHGHSHEDALRFFKRALAVDPNDYQSLVGVGLVYRRLKMFEPSIFWLHKAVSIGGLESTSLSLLVQACLEHPDESNGVHVLRYVRDAMGEHPSLTNALEKLESHL